MGKKLEEINLTQREIEVVEYLCEGLSAKQIAEKLLLSHRTVENKISWARLKVEAKNTTHLVAIYYQDKIKKIPINSIM